MRNLVGIDPGLSGCTAIIVEYGLPPVLVKHSSLRRDANNLLSAGSYLAHLSLSFSKKDAESIADFTITAEAPVIMPRQAGALTIGMNAAKLLSVYDILGVPVALVHPASWKACIPDRFGGGKAASVKACEAIGLSIPPLKPKGHAPDHNVADAILIAIYGYDKGETLTRMLSTTRK